MDKSRVPILKKMAKISNKNLDFCGTQILFWVDATLKYGLSKSKNYAQTILKQLPNNFEKSQNLSKKYAHHHPQDLALRARF